MCSAFVRLFPTFEPNSSIFESCSTEVSSSTNKTLQTFLFFVPPTTFAIQCVIHSSAFGICHETSTFRDQRTDWFKPAYPRGRQFTEYELPYLYIPKNNYLNILIPGQVE